MVDLGIGFGASIYGDPWGPFVDDGVIVGQTGVGASDEEPRAFAYDLRDGSPTVVNLGTLGRGPDGRYSFATGVDAGVVVGASTSNAKDQRIHGFAYDLNATTRHMIDLGAVDALDVDQRVIVGYRDAPADPWRSRGRAFYYRLDAATPSTVLFGPKGSDAKAIDGNIVAGSMGQTSAHWHPYAYDLEATTPRLIDLGSLGGRHIDSMAISGTTVTGTMETTADVRAFGSDLAAASPDLIGSRDTAEPPWSGDRGGHGRRHRGRQLARAWCSPARRRLDAVPTSAPALEFSRLVYTTPEGDHAATVTVQRTGDASGVATVGYTAGPAGAQANKDFEPVSGTLAFAAGETSQTFTIPILDDSIAEDRERIALWLSQPEGGVLGTPQMVALSIGASDIRPDAQVREQTDQQYLGDNVYNTTGADQTRRLTSRRGQSAPSQVAVCTDNAGPPNRRRVPGRFRLQANPAADGSRVRFLHADVDVTPTIRSAEGLRLKVPGRRMRSRRGADQDPTHRRDRLQAFGRDHLDMGRGTLTHRPCQGRGQGRARQIRTVRWPVDRGHRGRAVFCGPARSAHGSGSLLCQPALRSGVLGWLLAGPGSGLSEEPASGCESVALESESFPCCPPGPVPPVCVRASLSICW